MRDAIQAERGTTMWYGSEYRPIHQLEGIFKLHKDWEYLKNQLQKGAAYPLRKIGKAARLQNLHQMMSRGNHKSAESKIEIVRNLTQDDVTKGFALPLPRLVAPLIKNGEVYPVGLASNQTFNETGKEILRYRLTHDLSFPVKKGIAINDRVEKINSSSSSMASHSFGPSTIFIRSDKTTRKAYFSLTKGISRTHTAESIPGHILRRPA